MQTRPIWRVENILLHHKFQNLMEHIDKSWIMSVYVFLSDSFTDPVDSCHIEETQKSGYMIEHTHT